MVQGTASPQSRHPEGILLQVCTPLPEQRRAPSLHSSTHVSTQVPPEQVAGAVHAIGALQSVQPVAIFAQVATPLPEHSLAPTVH
jgi:hypothetical protein